MAGTVSIPSHSLASPRHPGTLGSPSISPMNFSPLRLGLFAAVSVGALAVSAPAAKAVCVNATCTVLDPTSPTIATNVGQGFFNGGPNIIDPAANKVRLSITYANVSSDVTVFGLALHNAPGLSNPATFGNVIGTTPPGPNGQFFSPVQSITPSVSGWKWQGPPATAISFTIPAFTPQPGLAANFKFVVQYGFPDSTDPLNLSKYTWISSTPFTTTTAVPGPLPILGGGIAFGFSRSLRRRIKAAKAA